MPRGPHTRPARWSVRPALPRVVLCLVVGLAAGCSTPPWQQAAPTPSLGANGSASPGSSPTGSTRSPSAAGSASPASATPGSSSAEIAEPNSYQQVFTIPAVDPAATSLSLSITYEMLLQTTPSSSQYARQTASDTLTIALS